MAKPGEEVSQPRGGGCIGPKPFNAVLPFRWQMPQNTDFVLVLYY